MKEAGLLHKLSALGIVSACYQFFLLLFDSSVVLKNLYWLDWRKKIDSGAQTKASKNFLAI